jgi:hypothetical protein
MEEDGKQAIVRRLGKGNGNRSKNDDGTTPKSEDSNRQYVDTNVHYVRLMVITSRTAIVWRFGLT